MSLTLEKLSLRIFTAFFGGLLATVSLAVADRLSVSAVIIVSVAAGAGLAISFFVGPRPWVLTKKDFLVILVILALTIFIGAYFHDLPLGRDPVSYSVAAIKIAETGSLGFHDILTRPYHGFTSLGGDNFTSQFLPGYNVYLANWYALGGLSGLTVANMLLTFLVLLAIYLVTARLSSRLGGICATGLTATFYAFLWFNREWASENLLALSFFASAAFLAVGIRERNLSWLLAGAGPAAFSILVRGEGLLYFGFYVLCAIIAPVWWRRQFDWSVKRAWWWLIWPVWSFIIFQLYCVKFGSGYVFEQGESIGNAIASMFGKFSPWLLIIGGLAIALLLLGGKFFRSRRSAEYRDRCWRIGGITLGIAGLAALIVWWRYSRQIPIVKWSRYRPLFVWEIFHCYYLTIFFGIIYLGIVKKVLPRLAYLLVFLAVPALVFILDPYIALDHPWFLRRFVAVFFPLVFMLVAVGLARWTWPRRFFIGAAAILAIINLAVSWPILIHREYDGSQKQVAALAENFTDQDLILMTPGWKWQKWAYYLKYLHGLKVLPSLEGFENKQEFFDLVNNYDRIFVISDRTGQYYPYYRDTQLKLVKEVTLKYTVIDKPLGDLSATIDKNNGQIDVYDFHRQQTQLPPENINVETVSLKIWQLEK